jgi:hypothetical protein
MGHNGVSAVPSGRTRVPASLEARRLAVVAALRGLATKPRPSADPVVDPVVDAVHGRLDTLSGQLDEVLARLDSVETALLESVWDSAPTDHPADSDSDADDASADSDDEDDRRLSVPAVALSAGAMSTGAARALFGA